MNSFGAGSLRAGLRARAFIGALVLLCGQAAVFGHLVTARHGFCPIHGEATELGAGHAARAAARVDSYAQRPTSIQPLSAAAVDHDEHCTIASAVLKGIETIASPVTPPSEVIDSAASRMPALGVLQPSIATLRLAPKHSPPASALA